MPPKDGQNEENIELNVDQNVPADVSGPQEEAPHNPAIQEQAEIIADREAREAAAAAEAAQKLEAFMTNRFDTSRALEWSTFFGNQTARYYQTFLKIQVNQLDEKFPENSTNDALKTQLKNARNDLAEVLDAKTENKRQVTASDALETLDRIDHELKKGDEHIDANLLEKQSAFLTLLKHAVSDVANAPEDPKFSNIADVLYHKLSDRIREVDARITTLMPDLSKDPNVVLLALAAKQSLVNIQQAVKLDAADGADSRNNTRLDKLRVMGNDYAALYLYQKINPYISFSRQEPSPKDSAERRAQIEEQKKAADGVLTDLRSKDLAKSIDQVNADKTFQTIKRELDEDLLNRIIGQPDGMLKANDMIEEDRQRALEYNKKKKAETFQKYIAAREKLLKKAAESERKSGKKLDESWLNEKLRKLDEEFDNNGLSKKERENARALMAIKQKNLERDKKPAAKGPDVRKRKPAGPSRK